jgi:hypothetical protein
MADQPVETAVSGLTTNPPFTNKVSYSNTAAPIPVASLYSSAASSGLSISNTNPNFRNAYTETFNLNVQQALPLGLVTSIGYYGSVGKHLRIATNENQPIAGNQANRPYLTLSGTSPIDHGANIASNITEANSISNSNYNAMWLTLGKSMAHGLEFNVNYDWTKSMDENSLGGQGGLTLQDSNNPAGNYGLSDFDVRNHVAGTMVYALPFKGNRFVSGYRLNAIFQFQSGNPVNITASSDTYTGVSGVVRPNQLKRPSTFATQPLGITNVAFIQGSIATNVCNESTVNAGCAFEIVGTQATPAAAVVYNGLGNVQRNSVTGPGFSDVDLSGEKETKLFEGVAFTLRADAFDILNHPNFGQPSGNVQSTTFGQITATRFATSDGGSSRQLQISGKFTF